jgi:hypothetical protein
MDVAAACFRRAGAAWISLLGSMNEDKVGIVPVLDHQSPDLHSLHVLLHGSRAWPFFESLKLYPALVELSIEHSNLMGWFTVDFRLEMLSRLYLQDDSIDAHSQPVVGLLQCTPHLKELVLNRVFYDRVQEVLAEPPTCILSMLNLQKMRLLETSPVILSSLLAALSPHSPSLQEVVVEADFTQYRRHDERFLASTILNLVMRLWKSISEPRDCLLQAELVWYADPDSLSWLNIRSTSNIAGPVLNFRTIYREDDKSLYRRFGLSIGKIQIINLQPQRLSVPWTTSFDQVIAEWHTCGSFTELAFGECCDGVPGLESWIHKQREEGRNIRKVTFRACGTLTSPTFLDYKAVKMSGLVDQVSWEDQ